MTHDMYKYVSESCGSLSLDLPLVFTFGGADIDQDLKVK